MNTGQAVLSVGIMAVIIVMVYNLFDSPDNIDFPSGLKSAGIMDAGGGIMIPNDTAFPPGGRQMSQPFPATAGLDRNLTAGTGANGTQRAAVPGAVNAYIDPNIKLAEGHWQGMEAMELTSELKMKLQLPASLNGLMVDEVTLNAAASGLLGGDILVEVDGRRVSSLKELLKESRRVRNRNRVPLTVVRNGRPLTVKLKAREELGFAQVETAPMIIPGLMMPHPYRGACTECHPIGTGGHVAPDPDGITLPPPPIQAGMKRPHQDRGPCIACHVIVN